MENNKKLWISVGLIVLVLAFGFWMIDRRPEGDEDLQGTETLEMESTEDTSMGSVNTPSPGGAALSYQQALVQYKDRRIQLDRNCQAIPNQVTYKNGTSIMLDNRSPSTRTIKLGSTFSIKAWGFKIVKLSSATVPATWYMDCDKLQNVATVLIQK